MTDEIKALKHDIERYVAIAASQADEIAAHDRRVTELLEANNREVERRRAERRAILDFLRGRAVQLADGDGEIYVLSEAADLIERGEHHA